MMCNLKSTWHSGRIVIAEEDVMKVKVELHFIFVEKSDGKKNDPFIACNWKNLFLGRFKIKFKLGLDGVDVFK
jgi:hypothetical protein